MTPGRLSKCQRVCRTASRQKCSDRASANLAADKHVDVRMSRQVCGKHRLRPCSLLMAAMAQNILGTLGNSACPYPVPQEGPRGCDSRFTACSPDFQRGRSRRGCCHTLCLVQRTAFRMQPAAHPPPPQVFEPAVRRECRSMAKTSSQARVPPTGCIYQPQELLKDVRDAPHAAAGPSPEL